MKNKLTKKHEIAVKALLKEINTNGKTKPLAILFTTNLND